MEELAGKSLAGKLLKVCSALAIAVAPGTGIVPPHAFAQSTETQSCFQVVMKLNERGKAVLVMPVVILGTEKGSSRTLVEIDPKCLDELNPPTPAAHLKEDKYEQAKKAIDEAVNGFGPEMTPEAKENAKNRLNEQVDRAEKFKEDPAEQVGAGALANAQEAEKTDDKDAAVLAAAGAVAAICMVASAGICSAAVAAILPSILPADVSTKDVAGIVRAVQGVADGRPLSPDEIDSIVNVLNTNIKVKPEDEKTLRTFLENGPVEAVKERLATATGLAPGKIDAGLSVLRKAIEQREFDCADLRTAFGITEIKVTDAKLRDRILGSIDTMRNSTAVIGEVRECLDKTLIVL